MQLENLKLVNDNGAPLYLIVDQNDSKNNVEATTLGLLRQIINQPQQAGENSQGQPIIGYKDMEEFQQGSEIYKKLGIALKQAPEGDKAGKAIGSFELTQKEFDFCKTLVKNYKTLYQAVVWAPFIEQFFPVD